MLFWHAPGGVLFKWPNIFAGHLFVSVKWPNRLTIKLEKIWVLLIFYYILNYMLVIFLLISRMPQFYELSWITLSHSRNFNNLIKRGLYADYYIYQKASVWGVTKLLDLSLQLRCIRMCALNVYERRRRRTPS